MRDITVKLIQHAVEVAYDDYYAKPMPHDEQNLKPMASNRVLHGIMHAIGAMELIPEIHALYKKYIPDYEADMTQVASGFELSLPELIILLQAAIIFHDSARLGDGIDHWDKESSENFRKFIQENYATLNPSLLTTLVAALQFKDHAEEFQKIVGYDSSRIKMDYLRQLISMGDNIEIVRCANPIYMSYLQIYQNSCVLEILDEEQRAEMQTDLTNLIIKTAKRVNEECRAFYDIKELTIVDRFGQTLIANALEMKKKTKAEHDHAFQTYCEKSPYVSEGMKARVKVEKEQEQSSFLSAYKQCLSDLEALKQQPEITASEGLKAIVERLISDINEQLTQYNIKKDFGLLYQRSLMSCERTLKDLQQQDRHHCVKILLSITKILIGIVAAITIIPALLVESFTDKGYVATFFKAEPSPAVVLKNKLNAFFQDCQTVGNDVKTPERKPVF